MQPARRCAVTPAAPCSTLAARTSSSLAGSEQAPNPQATPLPIHPSRSRQPCLQRVAAPTFCMLGTASPFSSLAGDATAARFSLVEAAELPFSSVSSSFSSLRRESGLRGHGEPWCRQPQQTCKCGPATWHRDRQTDLRHGCHQLFAGEKHVFARTNPGASPAGAALVLNPGTCRPHTSTCLHRATDAQDACSSAATERLGWPLG